ncbi:hypothetical protein K0M31_015768 [Melipona bicolor]|uniref:Uncharacterized protein n=1 Tax=Melipona bicolor TaxID=60889 RepID=A0AA40KEM3_9HYME|nr:hypothetical protein K0M31_015768 [Melipona bicolor]
MGSSNKARKHYKKDSRFVTDLYTFTYDDFDLMKAWPLLSGIRQLRNRNKRFSLEWRHIDNKSIVSPTLADKLCFYLLFKERLVTQTIRFEEERK